MRVGYEDGFELNVRGVVVVTVGVIMEVSGGGEKREVRI